MRLVKAEFRKITSTHLWWIFLLATVAATVLALLINSIQAGILTEMSGSGLDADQMGEAGSVLEARVNPMSIAANLYTSGQYLGLLFSMLLGILLVTNEYFHQTATTTFLVTPRRSRVIAAKLGVSVIWGIGLWLVTTVVAVPVGAAVLGSYDVGSQLGEWGVIRPILLNLLAYTVWAVFGVGIGTLIRSQIGAVVTALVLYLIGTMAAKMVIMLVANYFGFRWIHKVQVLVPAIASELMTTGVNLPGSPPQWVGAAVLIGYAAIAGFVGVLITRYRDIT